MRPCASQAARPEPIAIETVKMPRKTVTTFSFGPSTSFTSTGISCNATAPISQNQLVTIAPHSSRWSRHSSLSRPRVERAMLASTRRLGAPWPVRGMKRLDAQHSSAKVMISPAKIEG